MNGNDSHPEDELFEDRSGIMDDNVFQELMEHISTPSVPLTDVQRQRFTEAAAALKDAEVQAYIEANFSIQLLKLLQAVIPMIAGIL